jgi:hypothetical protein
MGAPDQALADLTEISSQVEAAALFDAKGQVSASTLDEPEPFVHAVQDLLAAAGEAGGNVAQLEAATPAGSVFVVRDGDEYIAATTLPEPTVALVFYDLKTALRAAGPAKKARRRTTKKKDPDAS